LTGISPGVARDEYGKLRAVYVSARTGTGLELLRDALSEILSDARAGDGGDAANELTFPTLNFSA